MNKFFSGIAQWASRQTGRAHTFALAVAVILIWSITGPLFHWSDTWQLVVNTGTTIVTFLMVFLIQNTQNRDTEAIQLKLDELIRVNKHARNTLLTLEDLTDDDLDKVKKAFAHIADEEAKEAFDPNLSEAEASERIDALQEKTGRGR